MTGQAGDARPKIRKAVFPVAGMGTRFLPATKSIPKEMLPIVDKPLIQYAVEEAIDAGIDTLVFVTSRKKHSISDHFDTAFELETRLEQDGKQDILDRIRNIIPDHVSRAHVPQLEPLGLGHAVLCARHVVGKEPFAVILADDLIRTDGPGCLKQMMSVYEQTGASVLGVEEVPEAMTQRYGIVATEAHDSGVPRVTRIVEKPAPETAPSRLGVVGRYLLSGDIFEHLESLGAGVGGEIQLTDAIAALLRQQPVHAFPFNGVRYDCGSRLGFVKATVDHAMEYDDVESSLREHFVMHWLNGGR